VFVGSVGGVGVGGAASSAAVVASRPIDEIVELTESSSLACSC